MVSVTGTGTGRQDYVRGGMVVQRLWLEATRLGVGLQPVSPIFGYAKTVEELVELVGSERGAALDRIRATALSTLGIESDELFVLALRAHYGPAPSAISGRVSNSEMVVPGAATPDGRFSGSSTEPPVTEVPQLGPDQGRA